MHETVYQIAAQHRLRWETFSLERAATRAAVAATARVAGVGKHAHAHSHIHTRTRARTHACADVQLYGARPPARCVSR